MWFILNDELQEYWEKHDRLIHKRIQEELELEEKIFRASHPILAMLDDARCCIARKILAM